ncbi:MAG: bifunctional metallophosphatase/5'-nucleotidase [Bacteroidetes bacterium]|nr:bifunctional metallophosphatase/5'-nucleotidase [Bacteroidota bacterium]
MKKIRILFIINLVIVTLFYACTQKDNLENPIPPTPPIHELTIFFVNDQHGQIENFSRIKHIVDLEKQHSNVLIACSGDMFSGNPIVDNYQDPGAPMIDVMNEVGFDITVAGNHEFDYGVEALGARMAQSDFDWVCANLDENALLGHYKYRTLTIDGLRLTFLGLVETNGKQDAVIPSTHPWKVAELTFQRPENIVQQYANLKAEENADLYIALTHLGRWADFDLAHDFPYFDFIIGGHSHSLVDTVVNGIPIFQAGSYLHYMGKIMINVDNQQLNTIDFELIDLDNYNDYDAGIQLMIDQYNNSMPSLYDVIGYSSTYHYSNYNVGCFYTDALRSQLNVEVSFQNPGGIRNDLDEGDITKGEIYAISPFKNGTIVYTMTVLEIKDFFIGSGSGFYYSGIMLEQSGAEMLVKDINGQVLQDNVSLTIGLNDYIPAVNDMYFPPPSAGIIQPFTDAESIIIYLENNPGPVNYPDCNRYFKYSFSLN